MSRDLVRLNGSLKADYTAAEARMQAGSTRPERCRVRRRHLWLRPTKGRYWSKDEER
jgi:hypothetical protein